MSAFEFSDWINRYNLSGVAEGSIPPNVTVEHASSCEMVICSTLPRSIQSAEVLSKVNCLESDVLYCEAGMPYADWHRLKLSPKIWSILFRVLWFCGYSKHSERYADAKSRAMLAALQLANFAKNHHSVLFVGHGIFNRLVAKELKKQGWLGASNPGSQYWAYSVYEKSA